MQPALVNERPQETAAEPEPGLPVRLPSRVVIDGETAAVVPRTTTSEVHRYKVNATDTRTLTRLTRKDNDPRA